MNVICATQRWKSPPPPQLLLAVVDVQEELSKPDVEVKMYAAFKKF